MTAIQKEVDEIISLMRQSKMDSIRSYLETRVKLRDKKKDEVSLIFLEQLKVMFKTTSNNTPIP
jgi:hypothetical protein